MYCVALTLYLLLLFTVEEAVKGIIKTTIAFLTITLHHIVMPMSSVVNVLYSFDIVSVVFVYTRRNQWKENKSRIRMNRPKTSLHRNYSLGIVF